MNISEVRFCAECDELFKKAVIRHRYMGTIKFTIGMLLLMALALVVFFNFDALFGEGEPVCELGTI